jgi:hypothetical protein
MKETTLDMPSTRYRTVSAAHLPDLDMKVIALLSEGWQLYGSPYSQGRAGHDALVCPALMYTGIVNPEDEICIHTEGRL